MKYASDFRSLARDALRGRWGVAVIAGILASLLGASTSGGPEVNLHIGDGGTNVSLEYANQQVFSTAEGWMPELNALIVGGAVYIILAAIVMAAVFFVLGSIIEIGYSRFNLDLVSRQRQPEIGTMFGYFPHWKTAAVSMLLRTVYIFLWSLLLIVPGIIASYSYAMTGYILAEHPELTPNDALAHSKELMYGNRLRLFCLEFSFIGWDLLCILTLGIGNLWLTPYKQAATAAFYREISGSAYSRKADFQDV
ncbi:MAG: DUF975 family protein [Oscillospiraceae bacterium]|nr:DUF975 family protein [Oscillospiraceae bacterium]